jgi:hypothetical protein
MADVTDAELLEALTGATVLHDDLVAAAAASVSTAVLVALAVRMGDAGRLEFARRHAATSRDRQLVVLAAGHLAGDHERFDALVRDHLAEHPDHVVAAWVAATHRDRHATNHRDDRRNPC